MVSYIDAFSFYPDENMGGIDMLTRNKDMEFISMDNEGLVVFDPASGNTYAMDNISKEILELCEKSSDMRQVCNILLGRYEGNKDEISNDIVSLISSLIRKGILAEVPG